MYYYFHRISCDFLVTIQAVKLIIFQTNRALGPQALTEVGNGAGRQTCCTCRYVCALRPVLDFAAPVYHPMLIETQRRDIERLQYKALKILYGGDLSYAALEKSGLTTLDTRHEELLLNFAQKMSCYAELCRL